MMKQLGTFFASSLIGISVTGTAANSLIGAECLCRSQLQFSKLKIEDFVLLQTLISIKKRRHANIFLHVYLFLPDHIILFISIIMMTKNPYQNIDPIVLPAV